MAERSENGNNLHIKIMKDGPYEVSGAPPLTLQAIGINERGESLEWVTEQTFDTKDRYYLCRCGHSQTKPFCDGSHTKAGFDGTEVADRGSYDARAKLYPGPALSLTDDETLCAFARFCDPNGQVWAQVEDTDNPAAARQFVKQVHGCPGGRLVAKDNRTGHSVGDSDAPSIAVTEDTAQGVSGPLKVEGGIPLTAADGFTYQRRNRVALCRCGQSNNKPFCDASHVRSKFDDGLR